MSKRDKKRNWIRRAAGLGCLSLAVILAGCGSGLSEKFDEDEVRRAAEEIIEEASQGSFREIWEEAFSPIMQNAADSEEIQKNLDYLLDGKGELKEFKKTEVKGIQDKDTGTEYATALIVAEYEEGKVMYTISFDENMKCAGFYMK